jgi:hypothetical protein
MSHFFAILYVYVTRDMKKKNGKKVCSASVFVREYDIALTSDDKAFY